MKRLKEEHVQARLSMKEKSDCAIASEQALAKDWDTEEEDAAWKDL